MEENAFIEMLQAAKSGNPQALVEVAEYYQSIGDLDQAFHYMKKAAELGAEEAYFPLANMYQHGLGTNIDLMLTKKYLQLSEPYFLKWTESFDEEDQLGLAYSLLATCLLRQDNSEAEEDDEIRRGIAYLEKACSYHDYEAIFRHGCIKITGNYGQVKEPEAGLKEIEDAAQHGHTDAQVALAKSYRTGDIVERDLSKAIYWLEQAAQAGSVDALTGLGYIYRYEDEVKDIKKAIFWLEKAVESEVEGSLGALGEAYVVGGDISKGLEALMKADAEEDDRSAAFTLGVLFLAGEKVKRDENRAYQYLKKAAAAGMKEAKKFLGYFRKNIFGKYKFDFKNFDWETDI